MSTSPPHPAPPGPGVVGSDGRYPLDERPVPALRLAGREVLPVGPLRMYTCGITPYDVTHLGHAATFVWADLVATLSRATGVEAHVARNVTDIDDVLTQAARDRGRPYDELALTQEFLFDRDMRALAVAAPTVSPHARAHITTTVRLAAALLRAGAAYERDGWVWFRGAGVPARVGLGEAEALRLSEEYGDQRDAPGRDTPFDVAVWRPSPPEHPAWPSPWGWGRPGWHAECAAMALCSLGPAVEVLMGGADLAFPHHAYQAAMVEAATGVRPFARAVLHVGEVRRDGRKMAKSTGNLVLVSALLERHPAPVLRLALLHRRWDRPWDYEPAVLDAAADLLARLRRAAASSRPPRPVHDGVLAALTRELDVPAAVRVALDEGGAAAASLLDVLSLGGS